MRRLTERFTVRRENSLWVPVGGAMVGRAYRSLKGGSPLDMLAALLGGG